MLQCQQHLSGCFVSSQIRDDGSQRVFFAEMMSCALFHVIIYHLFPISSQYLKL